MQGLTPRQQMVLDFIRTQITERGYPPTLREIGAYMGIRSTNGVNDHLQALERKGYLKRDDMKSRALRPVESSSAATRRKDNEEQVDESNMVDVPVLGRIAAGLPALAEQNFDDTVRVDRVLLGGAREVFALRVRGESMIGAGIHDGDYLFVQKQPTARNGQVVVALVDGEATVKYFFAERDVVRLLPANDAFRPIVVRRQDFRETHVLGVVVGLYRKM